MCLATDWALRTAVSGYQLSLTKVYQRHTQISVTQIDSEDTLLSGPCRARLNSSNEKQFGSKPSDERTLSFSLTKVNIYLVMGPQGSEVIVAPLN